MPPRFQKSKRFLLVEEDIEEEVLNEYALFIEAFGVEDVLLKDVPALLAKLHVPHYYYDDVSECIQWFYDTQNGNISFRSAKWTVATHLLQHLTISVTRNGVIDVSDVVDADKLVKFCLRLIKYRDSEARILDAWSLFVEAAGLAEKGKDVTGCRISVQDLANIKRKLRLNDLSDTILIDMLSCSGSTVEGDIFNYQISKTGILVGIKDFAEILGQLGQLD